MDRPSSIRPPTGFAPLLWVALIAAVVAPPSSRAEPPAEQQASRSTSVGIPFDGSLRHGEVLPRKGAGYVLIERTQKRRARFAVTELVQLVKEAAFKVRRKHQASVLGVGDLSSRKGGTMEHHGSHQNGRDVDFLFYTLDRQGKPRINLEFVPFDANGYSVDPPMQLRFDAARNWELVEAMLRSRKAEVQWIFVADHLKKLLLDHAAASGASRDSIRRARQVLHQPGPKAHWDHFHVRIYCPRGDEPDCRDVGPRWAWTKD